MIFGGKYLKNERRNIMSLNKYDLYIGKSLFCCCGNNCGKTYEAVSDIYEKDGKEVFDIKDDNTGEIESVRVDFISEYIEY